jgi:hypothetical protein
MNSPEIADKPALNPQVIFSPFLWHFVKKAISRIILYEGHNGY